MKIVTVIGNRPQFVKAAAVSRLLREAHDEVIVHTGQHHDDELSAIFFAELQVPRPEHQLHIAGGTNTEQTARMLGAIGPLLQDEAPDVVLVYGDTNSTVAGGLAAAQARIPVVHVEAGMRSFDRAMPEELNRVLTDHLSDLLLVPSETAQANLARESVAGRVVLVGDVMVDVSMMFQPRARTELRALRDAGVEPGAFVLCTAHRAGNVDVPERLRRLVDILLALDEPVVLPLHPRTGARLDAAGWLDELAGADHVRLAPPLGYMAFTALLTNARRVLTDSGGVQKEAYFAGVPCVTLRDTTEWVETVDAGWNVLVDLDLHSALTALRETPPAARPELYGDGRAGERVVAAIDAHT
ncbi:UDP-2,3-diacetamido-2,3-dideoxy-D-glucuronate 2-epimerase [Baekduia alba]|uniref:non-hydrolyzing UDP-N-acetylglucosamine 2-epimerase n=1 Tax=Baekduia alba TaxID=2997333 RepID=UPI0023425CB8|nr:UDP-N-acetylglucosamine 2-epimerase (non-hydrolyzing) [Baekduia alba]WCB97042.1 UDP-2,3-diacetamido-2,3-dideoxy-D-glucuronate 2-epimerase [Baekduia alba]